MENHDDFYTVNEGRVHVQDQRGYFIVYDCALSDFKSVPLAVSICVTVSHS